MFTIKVIGLSLVFSRAGLLTLLLFPGLFPDHKLGLLAFSFTLQARLKPRATLREFIFLTSSIAQSGKEEIPTTKNQSNQPKGSVLNTFCKNGTYTTAICNKKEIPFAKTSFLFVNTPSLNNDSVIFRQLNEWKS